MKSSKEFIGKVTKELVDQGLLIEAGWQSLRLLTIPETAPKIQLEEMRNAFFAGAQHLFGSIMTVLEPGSEPTDNDLKRFSLIDKELNEFIHTYKASHKL